MLTDGQGRGGAGISAGGNLPRASDSLITSRLISTAMCARSMMRDDSRRSCALLVIRR
jgi:hypothetical protein